MPFAFHSDALLSFSFYNLTTTDLDPTDSSEHMPKKCDGSEGLCRVLASRIRENSTTSCAVVLESRSSEDVREALDAEQPFEHSSFIPLTNIFEIAALASEVAVGGGL